MECFKALTHLKCFLYHQLLIFTFWLYGVQYVISMETVSIPSSHSQNPVLLAESPIASFDPIEISPAVIPHYPYPGEPSSPMYPSFPTTYEPVLTGKCPVNFSSITNILEKTASDCSAPLAALVGNVICCPQVSSLLHIFQGSYSRSVDSLILHKAAANDCFSDIMSILASRGANNTVPTLCSVRSSNLTGGSCPVKDVTMFEKMVNTSKLVEACSSVDSLRECCQPVCQPAIAEAAFRISSGQSSLMASPILGGNSTAVDVLTDCKGVVYAWLARNLSSDTANTAFRTLSNCKVNKVCPLEFEEPSAVIKACSDMVSPNPSCCSSLNTYIAGIQKQMLITNRQAINCAMTFGSMLQKGGVMTNVYELCDVDLKDFSLQAYGQQGCLLRSSLTDIVIDQAGLSFTCDLSDNIDAPWPSSSSVSSLSLCAPEMSLPALPTSQKSGHPGDLGSGIRSLIPIFSALIFSILS
ncbi:hypothetical protein H6P81_016025 [Aristolochia fimbriata]|uniref:SPARK domain-containing protein n=1 Tax=Aristolochia fimbriata TaxID=158543 RepID=A0AAV7E990_ARIFI|nr:hypothetical protein H6P81_016025 [Aristolochia fimbriata]